MDFVKYMTAADVGVIIIFDLALLVLGFLAGEDSKNQEYHPEIKKDVK